MSSKPKCVALGCLVLGCLVVVLSGLTAWAQQTGQQAPSQPAAAPKAAPAKAVPAREFSAKEQAARQQVFESERWRKARYELNEWLSVQTSYDEKQTVELKAQLQEQIANLSATELQDFLFEMENKIKVLMSPEMSQARSWVSQYYTPQYQKKIAKRIGVEDPARMTASQLTAALERFESQRRSRRNAQSAFNQSREQEVANQRAQQQARAQASEQAKDRAARSAARSGSQHTSAYAPQRMHDRYSTPTSRGPRYSIGPWGGVWRGGP
jgi:hypothetical protein